MKKRIGSFLLAIAGVGMILFLGDTLFFRRYLRTTLNRNPQVIEWIKHPALHPDWALGAGAQCGQAPFQLPTSGFIGYLWDDEFQFGHRHQGIDIFGGANPGETPVYAAYPGYLTRLPDWVSTLIVRIPSDPLQPDRQIWAYYTHMATAAGESLIAADFPPGTNETPVQAGQLLGYQGNYSGDRANPVGIHLHFSIVQDDGGGKYRNELEIANTLDPSPYFGRELNANQSVSATPECRK